VKDRAFCDGTGDGELSLLGLRKEYVAINGHANVLATFNLKDMRDTGARFGFAAQRAGSPRQADKNRSEAKIQLRLPEDLKGAATRQAAISGIGIDLLAATAVAARVGARAEAERYCSDGGALTTPPRAKALRLGTKGELRDDDSLDAVDCASTEPTERPPLPPLTIA
jgi:hypothetical protein